MSQNQPLTRLLRKLLRYGATGRAARIAERLSPRELAELSPILSTAERGQLLELVLHSPRTEALLALWPPELITRSLQPIPDARLVELLERQSVARAAQLLELLPEPRREQVRLALTPRRQRRLEEHRASSMVSEIEETRPAPSAGSYYGPGLSTLRRRLSGLFWR